MIEFSLTMKQNRKTLYCVWFIYEIARHISPWTHYISSYLLPSFLRGNYFTHCLRAYSIRKAQGKGFVTLAQRSNKLLSQLSYWKLRPATVHSSTVISYIVVHLCRSCFLSSVFMLWLYISMLVSHLLVSGFMYYCLLEPCLFVSCDYAISFFVFISQIKWVFCFRQ